MPNFHMLIKLLVQRIGAANIHLGTQLQAIHLDHPRHDDGVRLHIADGRQLTALAVVLAIPPQAIQNVAVRPDGLPAELRPALAPVQHVTGFVVRFSADFDTPANASGSFVLAGDGRRPVAVVARRLMPATLSGAAFHDAALDASAVKLAVVQRLCERAPATVEMCAWRAATWQQTVCRGRPTTHEWRRIVWSGTNAATANRGLCSGAVQGGQRAALLVLLRLRPAVVDGADIARVQPASVVRRRRAAGVWRRWCMSWNLSDAVRVTVGGPLLLWAVAAVPWPRRGALVAPVLAAVTVWLVASVFRV